VTTGTTDGRLAQHEQRIAAAGLPDPAEEARAAREAERERIEAELAGWRDHRAGLAAEYLGQLTVVTAALNALLDANAELAAISDRDDTAYRAAWQLGAGRPALRLPGALEMPSLITGMGRALSLAGQIAALRAQVER
jgi:hypothetical protein